MAGIRSFSSNKLFLLIVLLGVVSVSVLCFLLYRDLKGTNDVLPVAYLPPAGIEIKNGRKPAAKKRTHRNVPQLNFSCGKDGAVTIKSGGRLGNLMGEYATLWAVSRMHRLQPVLQPRTYNTLAKYFSNISVPPLQSLPCQDLQWKAMNLKTYNSLGKSQRIRLARRGIFIDGYPTSVTQFHRYRENITSEFTFKKEIQDAAQKKLTDLAGNRKHATYVGVHVRRTDYKDFLKERFGGELVSASYFARAIDACRKKFQNPLFVVVSDDMDWCRQNLPYSHGDIVYAGNSNIQNPVEDLALLASCNHSIITYGNFGFWGAYLAGGETFLAANVSSTPTELMHSIECARIPGWNFISAN